jgi:molecular chaperone HscB
MICWSCEKSAGEGLTCAACGAITPPDSRADRFQVLGVERRFAVDLAAVERRYKEMTRVLHPDRFARADARARRASLARSVQLNQAWRTLKDPVRRAEYLLELAGLDVGGELGPTQPRPSGERQRVPVPQALLLEMLELREELAEARAAGARERVAAMEAAVRTRRQAAMGIVATALEAADHEAAAQQLVAVRYYDRFLEEATLAPVGEAGHAG